MQSWVKLKGQAERRAACAPQVLDELLFILSLMSLSSCAFFNPFDHPSTNAMASPCKGQRVYQCILGVHSLSHGPNHM